MCTTYLGAVLLERLEALPLQLTTYPRLIRLNPNVPWKTRGNGSISFEYDGEDGLEDTIISVCVETIEGMSVLDDPQTNPGLALLKGDVTDPLKRFYRDCLHRIVEIDEARNIANSTGIITREWKNGRGLIGAIGAIGSDIDSFTYEAILYRPGHIKERERGIDIRTVRNSAKDFPSTFFNVDGGGDPLCIPHSPCPVIVGMRARDPVQARDAVLSISAPNRERWVLWRTNQHTDAHIQPVTSLEQAIPYSSVRIVVDVDSTPEYSSGGHLSFSVKDPCGNVMKAWAYEPTKGFRKKLSGLKKGDRIEVWGSIRERDDDHGAGINLEKVRVIIVEPLKEFYNPPCPDCGGSTESMGKGQGLRCKSCGKRDRIERGERIIDRNLKKGFIEPPEGAWRHLYKPVGMIPVKDLVISEPFHGKF